METARDARLLPRLIAALDTLDNDGEIVETVRQIRRILGPGCFATGQVGAAGEADLVSLEHPNAVISRRLRGLGATLRLLPCADPQTQAALAELQDCLMTGAGVARLDLLTVLAELRVWLDPQIVEPAPAGFSVSHTAFGELLAAELRTVMAVLYGATRR